MEEEETGNVNRKTQDTVVGQGGTLWGGGGRHSGWVHESDMGIRPRVKFFIKEERIGRGGNGVLNTRKGMLIGRHQKRKSRGRLSGEGHSQSRGKGGETIAC